MKTCEVGVWIVIDSEGQYVASASDADTARENYENEIGTLGETDGFRLVKVTLTVPLPVVSKLTGTVQEHGEAKLQSAN